MLRLLLKKDLSHDDVLTLLNELALGLDDGLQELEVLDVAAVRLDAVDKVLYHTLVDLTAQLEVIHEDMLHGDCLEDLKVGRERRGKEREEGEGERAKEGWRQKRQRKREKE